MSEKQNETFFLFKFCCENHPPTRHIKYKVITFAPSNKSILANKLLSKKFETTSLTD